MKTLTLPNTQQRRLLFLCLAISLCIHAAFLLVLSLSPLILRGPFNSLFGISAAKPTMLETDADIQDAFQKNHALEEVFQKIVVLSPHFQQPYDLAELPKGIALAPDAEESSFTPETANVQLPTPDHAFALASQESFREQEVELTTAPFLSPPEAGTLVASQLQIDVEPAVPEIPNVAIPLSDEPLHDDVVTWSDISLDAAYEADITVNLSPQLAAGDNGFNVDDLQIKTDPTPKSGTLASTALKLDQEQIRSTLFIPKAPSAPTERRTVAVRGEALGLEEYDFPAAATATAWNDDFDVDVTFLPNPEGEGYIFSLAVQPNYDISSQSVKQNLYFVLDRSSSVQKHRFGVFKRAVLKALSSMQQGDTFNILVMDKKVAKFSEQNRPVSMRNIGAAEEFLDRQEAGGLFAFADIYQSIDKILPLIPDNDESHTAILLTDGKTSMNTQRKQMAMNRWIEKNNGKVCLYAAAVGRDNDLLSLDMLATISGGKLLYSDTHASLPRKLSKLILDLKDPVAKDIMLTAIPQDPNAHIELFPAGGQLPELYSHQPYKVIGKIDKPCKFELVMQGRHRDQWIAIKKSVSFMDGKKGNSKLEKEYTAQQANVLYSKFLKEGKNSHLKNAKTILKQSRTEVAFE